MGLVTVYCPFRRYDFSYLGVAHGPAEIVGRAERGDFMPPVCVCVCLCVHSAVSDSLRPLEL